MTLGVTALVLLAALMHASWNALIKSSSDTILNTAFLAGAAALICAPLLFFVPLPAAPSWPYLLASALVHQFYFALVGAAYRQGDLSFAYPLMRGTPPLLVACAGIFLLQDESSPGLWAGVVAISAGVLWLGGFPHMLRHAHARSTAFALGNAVLIAAYTLIDALGVRVSGNAASYGLWLFVLMAPPYVGIVVATRRAQVRSHLEQYWGRTLLAGALSIGAYGIALEAMTRAPVAAVAALRETSVIFAALMGTLLLKEPFGQRRIAGACVIAAGIALMKL